jgi:hypothetical protein
MQLMTCAWLTRQTEGPGHLRAFLSCVMPGKAHRTPSLGLAKGRQEGLGHVGTSASWITATPFMSAVHRKKALGQGREHARPVLDTLQTFWN